MKVLVTGAAGRMGVEVCRSLLAQGHQVLAADRCPGPDPGAGGTVHVLDLLDRHAVDRLVSTGVEAVVHLANHTYFNPPDPQLIFGENMRLNINVLQSAVDHGARKAVFASSIQVIFSEPRLPAFDPHELPACLPFDERTPIAPTNPYALSKQCGELLMEYLARVHGVQAVGLRLPRLVRAENVADLTAAARAAVNTQHAFAYLSYPDSGRLVAAILAADLPGYRVYVPASRRNVLGRPARELVEDHLPGVPLGKRIEGESLIDITTIERETGWSPRD